MEITPKVLLSNLNNWDFKYGNYKMQKEEAEICKTLLQTQVVDNINPTHYQKSGRKECIDEIKDLIGEEGLFYFCIGNCYKYLYRAGDKVGNSAEQDYKKAKWYYDKASSLGLYPQLLDKLQTLGLH